MGLPTWTLLPEGEVPCPCGQKGYIGAPCFFCRSPGADLVPVLDPGERDAEDARRAKREMRGREWRSAQSWEEALHLLKLLAVMGPQVPAPLAEE